MSWKASSRVYITGHRIWSVQAWLAICSAGKHSSGAVAAFTSRQLSCSLCPAPCVSTRPSCTVAARQANIIRSQNRMETSCLKSMAFRLSIRSVNYSALIPAKPGAITAFSSPSGSTGEKNSVLLKKATMPTGFVWA